MILIMLDGFAGGQVFDWRDAPLIWKIKKPIKTNPHEQIMSWDLPIRSIEYKLTFISKDGRTALYSISGDSEQILAGRDWIKKSKLGILLPIYFTDNQFHPRPQKEEK